MFCLAPLFEGITERIKNYFIYYKCFLLPGLVARYGVSVDKNRNFTKLSDEPGLIRT